jgi:hypothetical protein
MVHGIAESGDAQSQRQSRAGVEVLQQCAKASCDASKTT